MRKNLSKMWHKISDNFSFQNNGIKKCTCWKTMGFFGKQWVFLKSNVLDTTSHMIYFRRIHLMCTVIHNCVFQCINVRNTNIVYELNHWFEFCKGYIFSDLFNKTPRSDYFPWQYIIATRDVIAERRLFFSCRKSLRFFSAHILKLCVFYQKCAWKTQNADQKLSLHKIFCYKLF